MRGCTLRMSASEKLYLFRVSEELGTGKSGSRYSLETLRVDGGPSERHPRSCSLVS